MKVYIHLSKSALILVVNKYKENWAVLIWVRQYYVIVSFSSNDPCCKTALQGGNWKQLSLKLSSQNCLCKVYHNGKKGAQLRHENEKYGLDGASESF